MANTARPQETGHGGPATASADGLAAGPERLQTAIRITSPGSWIIAAVCAFATLVVIIWGVFGELTTRVSGLGIVLAADEDILELQSSGPGTVIEIPFKVGDQVAQGDLIARLVRPGGDSAIVAASQRIARMQGSYDRRQKEVQANLASHRAVTENHKDALADKKQTLIQRVDHLTMAMKSAEAQFSKGIVSAERVQALRDDLDDAQAALHEIGMEIPKAELAFLEFQEGRQAELSSLERELEDAKGDLETLRQTQADETRITAPISGRIISVETAIGDVLAAGAPVSRVYADSTSLRVVAFLKASEGKKVSPGMDVSVSPSTAERSIWGSIRGRVQSVSDLPATVAAVNTILVNPDLTEEMFASGPPILVEVVLQKDPNTPSGLVWTSGNGPPYAIDHGTLSALSVVVRREAPANLVVPVFWSWVGHGS
jgi:NHLM bacteriocin system secretion protein